MGECSNVCQSEFVSLLAFFAFPIMWLVKTRFAELAHNTRTKFNYRFNSRHELSQSYTHLIALTVLFFKVHSMLHRLVTT